MNVEDVVWAIFFDASAGEVLQLLGLLEKSTKGKSMANYAAIVAERANLPDDVLQVIPLESIANSAMGAAPASLWQQLSGAIGGAITSAVNFIKNAVIAVGEFIKHAAEVIANAALSLYSTAVSTVKKAVVLYEAVYLYGDAKYDMTVAKNTLG